MAPYQWLHPISRLNAASPVSAGRQRKAAESARFASPAINPPNPAISGVHNQREHALGGKRFADDEN
jgi:hypothetical protein